MEEKPTIARRVVHCMESAGLSPLRDPRGPSRRAALEAIECIHHHTTEAEDGDLQVALRLLAVIATINGPGDDRKH